MRTTAYQALKFQNRGDEMPVQTRRELMDRIEELESENETLRSRLEEIGDLASTEEEEEDTDRD